MNKPIRIPTIFALLFVGVLLLTMTWITKIISQPTQADVGKLPKDIQVTNVSDTSFTVLWITEKPTRGVIQVTPPDGQALTFYDDHAVQSQNQEFTTHSVTVRGMQALTQYTITFLNTPDKTLTITTGPTLSLNSNQLGPLHGSVKNSDGTPAVGSLVYLALEGSQILSTTVKDSGSFLIPLNLLRTEDTTAYLPVKEEPLPVTLTIISPTGEKTIATTNTDNDSPVPDITLGQPNDFTQSSVKPTPVLAEKQSSFQSVLGTINTTAVASSSVTLATPIQGGIVRSEYPFITGKGIPDEIVTIIIGSKSPTVDTVRVKKDGTWQFTPKKGIPAGNQSVTISSFDENKNPISITHLFQIMKSGTQVLGDATPSASPTIILPTPISTISATPIPTLLIEPTPTTEIPTTATTVPTYILLAAGISLSIIGLLVFIL